MLIVDSQIHLWQNGKMSAHHRQIPTYSVDDALAEMASAGVDCAVIHPPSSLGEAVNVLAVEAVRRHPDKFCILGHFDLESPDREKIVARWRDRPGMLGFRFTFNQPHQKAWWTDGSIDWFWAACERAGLPVGLLAGGHMAALSKIAERHPRLKLHIEHLGRSGGGTGVTDDAAFADLKEMLALAKLPNVGVKMSGAPSYSSQPYPYKNIHGYLRQIFEAFGPERSFWGTDITRMPCSYRQCVTMFTEELSWLKGRTGYDTFWLAEHHFQREGYESIPNILMLALHLCHITRSIKIGCGFNIAPMWHPLRMAEDYATADWLTGGRVIFGVGRGYHTREVEVFGAPLRDQDANRELFEEQVEIIFKSFNERAFSHQGKYYTLPPQVPYRGYELSEITLVPRPKTLPVECWQPVVSASARALDFMAKHGIKGIIGGGAAPGGANEKVVHAFREARARAGRETKLGGDLCIGFSFHIADSVEQGIKEATPFFEENIKMFAPLGFVPGLTPEQIDATADPKRARQAGLPTLRHAIKAGTWLIGPPELITEQLLEIQHKYPGLEVVNVGQPVGTPQAVILEQLERFAA